jgi:tetratricopeptide (TPR) repeat protein
MDRALTQTLNRSDGFRRASRWQEAKAGYESALSVADHDPIIAHNLALCHLALGEYREAVTRSARARELNDQLWQSAIVQAKALSALGLHEQAIALLKRVIERTSNQGPLDVELATLLLQHGGDAAGAVARASPWIGGALDRDARIVVLLAQLYDRDEGVTAAALSTALCRFSQQYLQLPAAALQQPLPADAPPIAAPLKPVAEPVATQRGRGRAVGRRPRVGLLSPQFTVSPVYFFTFGALQMLANEVDLTFFSRGTKSDWGTEAFRGLATDWIDASNASAETLSRTLARHDLDVAIDLGGWMDPAGLSALSAKPARRQYKWVGGQSATTGLKCFDGYLTDRYQTPQGSEALFSEPLLRLKGGYVSYTPPPYLPPPAGARDEKTVTLGIVANPAKVSRGFLDELRRRLPVWEAQAASEGRQLRVQFIDQRYQQASIRARIEAALSASAVAVDFLTPVGHQAYLIAVGRLDAVIDTWPYTGGLTTVEALAMGVPVYTHSGALFCERHSAAHCAYAGFELAEVDLGRFDGLPRPVPSEGRLIAATEPASRHDALAEELLPYLRARPRNLRL